MNAGDTLLRRQVIAVTLLVAGASLLLVAVNLFHQVNLLTAGTLQIADTAGRAVASAYAVSVPTGAQAATVESPTAPDPATGTSNSGFVPTSIIRIISSSEPASLEFSGVPALNAFAGKSFPAKLYALLIARETLYRHVVDYRKPDGNTSSIQLAVSLEPFRHDVVESLTINLVISSVATIAAMLLASFFTKLAFAPLSAIASSIEQLEQHHSGVPIRRTEREKSNYMELVADRIQQIGMQIAGDRTELLEARGRLNQILSSLQERVLLVNSEGRVMLASPGVQQLLGATVAPETRILEDFVGSDHPLVILVRLALASGESTTHATLPGMRDRRSKPLAVTVQLIVDRGETAGAFISLHDRETVAKLESQLDYSERLADLARITSGIAHEVKNPLNAMVIHLELLREKLERFGPQTIDVLPQVEILTSEIQRLERVVQTFLTFNKAPRMQLRPLDVNQVLRETIALAEAEAQAHMATVEQDFTILLPRIAGDADMLKQAFLNIIINGFQAMEDGGLLRVQTSGFDHHVKISITDHGDGIDFAAQDRIFQLYYSTKPAGNGIGLAQAYRAIQLHNGRIGFTSQTGVGTTFDITIPTT